MNYLLIKDSSDEKLVKEIISLATFISIDNIHKLEPWCYISKKSYVLSSYIRRPQTEDLPIWHFKHYLHGARDCDVWRVDGSVRTDLMLIQYLGKSYMGTVSKALLKEVTAFVDQRVKVNALSHMKRKLNDYCKYCESEEFEWVIQQIDSRMSDVSINAVGNARNLVLRKF
jgi:hypothetical protein